MSADKPESGQNRPFDLATIEHLVELMARHDLSEIALSEGDQRIRLRKGAHVPIASAPLMQAMPVTLPSHGQGQVNAAQASPEPQPSRPDLVDIKSEMVGTFYTKPKPDKPDYVSIGSRVKPDSIVCQIEAMKIFNEVAAGVSGTIVEICMKNGDFVEFGTVLFRVDPS